MYLKSKEKILEGSIFVGIGNVWCTKKNRRPCRGQQEDN